jgi:hypothetical protein
MTNIVKSDPYMEFYATHKALHPEERIMLRAFRQRDLDDVDYLVKISRGNRETVKTEDDWNVLANIVIFYIKRWPQEWAEFRSSIPDIRQTRGKGGYSQSREMKYLAAIPLRLERLIKAVFPMNQVNKKFSNEFIRRFKVFQIGGVQN